MAEIKGFGASHPPGAGAVHGIALTAVNGERLINDVNRLPATDSKNALDAILLPRDIPSMQENRSSHFIRRDATRNMNRFYRLTVTRDLFGTTLLVREWGRIGVYCRTRFDEKANGEEAERHAADLARQKMRRGYVPVAE